jgi:hypothetical protein
MLDLLELHLLRVGLPGYGSASQAPKDNRVL